MSKSACKCTNLDWMKWLCKNDRELLELMELDWPGAVALISGACARYAQSRPSCDPHELTRAAQATIDGYRRARAAQVSDRARLCAFAAALAEALDMDLDPVIPDSLHILRAPEVCSTALARH